MSTIWKYMPILKWKQGERIALSKIPAAGWSGLVPLVELLPIISAPDGAALRANLPAYLGKIAKEISRSVPEDVPIAVDVRYVAPAYPKQLSLLAAVCQALIKLSERRIIPVLTETMVANEFAELPKLAEYADVVLRVQTGAVDHSQLAELARLLVKHGLKKNLTHLVLDQHSLLNEDPGARFVSVRPYLSAALGLGCASVTLAGGSFPKDLIGIKQGTKDIPRVEWAVWQLVRSNGEYAAVRYSDYTVSHPALAPALDPTAMNPSVAIRYAADGFWRLFKAGGFKKGKPNQYQMLSTLLLGDVVYSGKHFSFGDDSYDKAASAMSGNGNPSSWRRDATSHHIALVQSVL